MEKNNYEIDYAYAKFVATGIWMMIGLFTIILIIIVFLFLNKIGMVI